MVVAEDRERVRVAAQSTLPTVRCLGVRELPVKVDPEPNQNGNDPGDVGEV